MCRCFIGNFVDKVPIDCLARAGLQVSTIVTGGAVRCCGGGVNEYCIITCGAVIISKKVLTGQVGIVPLVLSDLPDPLVVLFLQG